MQQWAAQLDGAPNSDRKTVSVLSGALQLPVEDGRLSSNPPHRLKLPRVVKSSKWYLTHDQVAALSNALGERSAGSALGYDMAVLVLAYCGRSSGELAGMRASDVDLARGRIHVRETIVTNKGYPRVEPCLGRRHELY